MPPEQRVQAPVVIVENPEQVAEVTAASHGFGQAAAPSDCSRDVFGSFWIDKTEFALPVTVIQEVVNEPECYSPVPLSPPHVIGLFSLRKTIVPVVDLRVLLGFPEASASTNRKVAILENGDLCIGLLFDDTGGVISGSGVSRVNFQPSEDGIKDVIVEGVLKLDGGSRMVQLLDPFEILKIKKLPRVAKENSGKKEKSHLGRRLNCISFQLGHTTCAIDLRYVQEITDVPEVQKSQIAHGHILGNIELRGRTMPIIDFRGLMGNEEPFQFSKDALKSRKLVILNLEEGHVGLVVYSIDSIMTFFESDILPFANVALPRHDIVSGCLINDANEIVIFLDHKKLLRDELLVNAAKSCQEIYPSDQQVEEKAKLDAKTVKRASYILFSVDVPMAFDIAHVSEIINRPEKLLQPPYALDFVDGILNLRGDLITLIDPRVLYNLPDVDHKGSKVLIFHKEDKKYGIVVDSVDEIVTTTTSSLMDVPSFSKNGIGRLVSRDVVGCLRVPGRSVDSDPVLVLDVGAVVSRCVEAESFEQ